MKIAVIGGGISGMTAAEKLSQHHQVTLFEANRTIGGHADTHSLDIDEKTISVDTGFIVFNPDNYPTFTELLNKYQVNYKDSDMSFAVSNRVSGLEYNASSINKLFIQRKNLINPKFYRMLSDIFRFNKEAKSLLDSDSNISLGKYLQDNRYSSMFINEHIIPMTCALWSGDTHTIFEFPAKFLVAFMNNHKMLQAFNRPIWKTIEGGSRCYLDAIAEKASFDIKTSSAINSVIRSDNNITLITQGKSHNFDKIIFSCHSDQALAMLNNPSAEEHHVLSAIPYQKNIIQLHHDESVLPRNKSSWASWNVLIDDKSSKQCTVSYYMNLLQSLETQTPVIVSLNMQHLINQRKVWKEVIYHHPVFNGKTIAAQKNKHLIQGKNNSYYCGAYWGWGFHEDGALSGKQAAEQLLRDCHNA